MSKLFKKQYPNLKLQFVCKPSKQLSSLFKYKDRSNVKYSCSGCNATYHGKISRDLKTHCNEYFGIGKSGSKLASQSPSSIWDHIKQTGHSGSLDDFSVICSTNNFFGLLVEGPVYIIPFSYENGMEMLSYENGIV